MLRYGIILAAAGVLVGLGFVVNAYSGETDMKSEKGREEFIRNFKHIGLDTTADDARFLRILVASSRAKRGVEVGTARGFGAMNMGLAFERSGGHLDTVDIDPDMVKTARENLIQLGLEKTVTVIEGDALKVLPDLKGEVDFVFIDALKSDYMKYFRALEPKMKPGAVLVADNVIQYAGEMKDFLDFMQKSPDWDTVIIRASLEKKDGMAVCYKIR
jgi:predicted O-methyltransferase YrrM